jgi:glycosyltransferase involved in cell wall biosynthesis
MKKTILIFGKVPPPYIGPAVATEIILESDLKNVYNLVHFDTSHHKTFDQLGKLSFKNLFYPFILYFRLVIYITRYSPDIVYIPSQQTTIAFLRDIPFFILTKIFRKKLVCHLRGGYFLKFFKECNVLMKLIIKTAQKCVDAQIVLGNNLISIYEKFMSADKIFVVPNGRDFNFDENIKSDKDKINILFLGNLIEEKGIIDFINAAIKILEKGIYNVSFQFAGNHYNCKEKIQNLISSIGNLDIVDIGHVQGKIKTMLLQNADIFVFPTYYRNEGHPWVIVEALAAGLPIISTDWGAISESVIDGSNGFIVEPKNVDALSLKIEQLLNDEMLRVKMGRNSKSIYEKKFTQKSLVKNFKHVFDTILEN